MLLLASVVNCVASCQWRTEMQMLLKNCLQSIMQHKQDKDLGTYQEVLWKVSLQRIDPLNWTVDSWACLSSMSVYKYHPIFYKSMKWNAAINYVQWNKRHVPRYPPRISWVHSLRACKACACWWRLLYRSRIARGARISGLSALRSTLPATAGVYGKKHLWPSLECTLRISSPLMDDICQITDDEWYMYSDHLGWNVGCLLNHELFQRYSWLLQTQYQST